MPEYKNIAENTMLSDAIALAVMAHRGQIRKDPGEMPYIVHPLHAMQLLIDNEITDKYVLTAMVLHDVVEDTHVGMDLIRRQFPSFVADMVAALSKDAGNKGTMHEKSAAGHGQTMMNVKDFNRPITIRDSFGGHTVNPCVLLKQADRLSNLMGSFPENWDIAKHEQYLEQSKEIYQLDTSTELAHRLYDMIREYSIYVNELRSKNGTFSVDDTQPMEEPSNIGDTQPMDPIE